MTALNKKRLFPREAEALRGRTAQCAREGHVPPPPPRVPRSCRPFQVGLTGRCLHPAGGTDACDSEESDVPQSGMERCPPRKPGSEKTAEHHHRRSHRQSPTTRRRHLSPKAERLRSGVYATEGNFHFQENVR